MAKMYKGRPYVRIAPAKYGSRLDYSYTTHPMIYDGKDEYGNYIMHGKVQNDNNWSVDDRSRYFGKEFFDENWIPWSMVKRGPKSDLHKYKDKMIRRIRPVDLEDGSKDCSFNQPVRLISATKYHLVIWNELGKCEMVLDSRYTNPEDWEVVEMPD